MIGGVMQYRHVKATKSISQQRQRLGKHHSNHMKRANRFLPATAAGFAITSLILLGILLNQHAAGRIQGVPESAGTTALYQQLQILQLEQQTNGWSEFRSYVPLLSAAIAFVAGVFGAYRYFRDQDRDYALRVEQEISSNLSQLLDFTKEGGSQNARIACALDNLTWLIGQASEPVHQIDRVTAAIVAAIKDDINLENLREARFPALCLEHWPAYTEAFKKDARLQSLLLYRYNEALAKLAKKAPDYFSVVEYDSRKSFVASEDVNSRIEEPDYQYFVVLVDGLWQHLTCVEDQEVKMEVVADFQRGLANSHLFEQLQQQGKNSIGGIHS
jgi:hypothetical protein